jgi:hypothetical protein
LKKIELEEALEDTVVEYINRAKNVISNNYVGNFNFNELLSVAKMLQDEAHHRDV